MSSDSNAGPGVRSCEKTGVCGVGHQRLLQDSAATPPSGLDNFRASCGDGPSGPSRKTHRDTWPKKFICATRGPDGLDSPSSQELGGFLETSAEGATQQVAQVSQ